jgi:glycosyltransferase involved in cell wall biosynthesis
VGDGPERGRLEKLAKKLQVYDRVDFVGNKNRNHVLQYMEKANVFAMVSSPETFGLVYIEAMAKGCITIGSKGEGIDGVIEDGENGFLCKAGDVKALTSVLESILSLDKATKTRIISNAIDTARNLTQENVSREYYHNLRAILCNSKGCR